jgi:NADH-quinone oxidoreductase subunit N
VNAEQVIAMLPMLIIATTSIVVLLVIAIWRRGRAAAWLTHLGLMLAGLSAILAARAIPQDVTPLLVIDGLSLFYQVLLIAATLVVSLMSASYLRRQGAREGEFYVLLLIATLGAALLTASRHFASLFLGLETLSVSLYGLLGYVRNARRSTEAAIKYLILAGATSALLLFGMALLYARLGTMNLAEVASALIGPGNGPVVAIAMALIIAGIAFKLALVPFHWWTPDVYEGAPAPVTAYVASVSKGAVFALLLRFLGNIGLGHTGVWVVLYVCAAGSMLAGNALALLQDNVKRLLAYSSISHLGYALVPLLAGGEFATQAATFYILAYIVTILTAFGVVSVLSEPDGDADRIDDYRGLFSRQAPLALVFTASLLSLAGIPLTAGFVAKFHVAAAGASASLWALLIILAVSSTIGMYYYLRVIVAMISSPESASRSIPRIYAVPSTLLGMLLVVVIWLGVYPAQWLHLISFSLTHSP